MLLKSVELANQVVSLRADGFHFFVNWNDIEVPFEQYWEADLYFEDLFASLPEYAH